MPVRLIMNNRTLTVLEGTEYEQQVHTFNLRQTKFYQIPNKRTCFGIQEESPTRVNVPMDMVFCDFNAGKTHGLEWVNEWDYDFNLFKYQCSTPSDWKSFNNTLNNKEENDLNNKLNQAKADIIKEKELKIQKQAEEEEVRNAEEKINIMELEAIQKEFNLEELIEKEEEQREKAEEEKIRLEIEEEKEKKDCLLKSIREKTIENQFNLMKESEVTDLTEQKKKAKEDIINKRMELNNKIREMKKRAARRMRMLRQELKGVKSSINDQVKDAYRKGGFSCSFNKGDKIYCKAKFTTNPEEFGNCMRSINTKEDWCGICCNNEIGSMFPTERHKCAVRCIYMPPSPPENGLYDPKEKWFAAIKVSDEGRFGSHASDLSGKSVQSQEQKIAQTVNDLVAQRVVSQMSSSQSQQSSSFSSSQQTSSTSSSFASNSGTLNLA